MRSRLPIILIALTILFAFVAAGCGDDTSTSDGAAPAGATQTTDPGTTGSSGAASESAQLTLDNCEQVADAVQDKTKAAKAKKACQDAYDNIQDASAKIDQATSDARAKCEEAANKIPNEAAKADALAACAKFN